MWFGKEKMHFGSFCRISASANIKVPPYDLTIIDPDRLLSSQEMEVINTNLHTFRLVLLNYLLMEKISQGKIQRTPEEVGNIFARATMLAYEDNNYSKEEINTKTDELLDALDYYFAAIENVHEDELNKNGLFFFLCSSFATRCFPQINNSEETERYKNFMAFDVAKQIYRIVEETFIKAYKSVKLLD